MKIMNIKHAHDQLYGKRALVSDRTMRASYRAIERKGLGIARDGRAYPPFRAATPLLPDGRHGRWQKGRVVPRKG